MLLRLWFQGMKNNNEIIVVAQRGRPSGGEQNRQQLEPNLDGLCNAITTVQKDNYLLFIEDERYCLDRECMPNKNKR